MSRKEKNVVRLCFPPLEKDSLIYDSRICPNQESRLRLLQQAWILERCERRDQKEGRKEEAATDK